MTFVGEPVGAPQLEEEIEEIKIGPLSQLSGSDEAAQYIVLSFASATRLPASEFCSRGGRRKVSARLLGLSLSGQIETMAHLGALLSAGLCGAG